MNCKHELVKMSERLPAKIVEHKNYGKVCIPNHWHKSLEMTYVLKYSHCEISVNGRKHILKENNIVLINSGEIHGVESQPVKLENTIIGISIIIDYKFLKENYENFDNIVFVLDENKKELELMKDKFKEIMKIYDSKENNEFYYIKVISLIYEIIYLLFHNFMEEKKLSSVIKTQKHIDRLKKITQYINENYREAITLEEVAYYFGLSREHLARNFKKYMDITFKEYLTSVRLYNANKELMNTDYSVLQIALDNGFPDARSFINKFKEVYNETPNKYRKNVIRNNTKLRIR